jgi:CheY-like chemotaxis protein
MDDEEPVREITSKLLTMLGHKVNLAENGEEAIEMYKNSLPDNKYDVIFMDLIVPGKMGGQEAIKKILEIDPNAKAIISSGYSTGEIMSKYKEYGFRGVLTKPYKIEEVQRILNEIQ